MFGFRGLGVARGLGMGQNNARGRAWNKIFDGLMQKRGFSLRQRQEAGVAPPSVKRTKLKVNKPKLKMRLNNY